MTSYLPAECRADRGNPDKSNSKEASKKRASNRYQPFDPVERGSQQRGCHLANGWSSLKLSWTYNACTVSLTREQ